MRAHGFKLLHHVHAFDDCPEDHMPVVQPGGLHRGDEELGAVGIGAGVGHRHDARAGVLQLEVLITEFATVDRFAPGTVVVGEVSSLAHEVGNHAVESGTFVPEALLARAQCPEVLNSLRHYIRSELQHSFPHIYEYLSYFFLSRL